MTRRSQTNAPLLPAASTAFKPHIPLTDQKDGLTLLLRSALVPPFSDLRQILSDTQHHFMRSFYVPTVPDLSDPRRTQFQHRSNATSALFEAVKDRGFSRDDVRLGLEQGRYLPFLHEVEPWIRSGGRSTVVAPPSPKPIAFDIRNRAYAKDAFQQLARELRIPYYMFDHGIIEPVFVPHTGFAIRVHADNTRWTFLTALSNGTLLAPPLGDSQELARGLSSPNRQLRNIFELQAPVHLEKALEPRPISDVGTKRVSSF